MNETLFLPAGDSAVNVEFGRIIDPEINKKIRSLSDSLSRKPIRGVTECIPTFRSLLVCYDPLQTGCEALIKKLKKRIKSLDQASAGEKRVFNIPVCYGGEFGEDIAFVASHAGLTEQEVIDIHTGRDYLIFMLGFLPGFAYLGDMDKRLHTPRLSNPRTSIPAGSVGIGGEQTGIYPLASPGGWQLIGRTPVRPYDPNRAEPILYSAGDYIRFFAVDEQEYRKIEELVSRDEYECKITAGEGTDMSMHIISPGMLTTVQDLGRCGYMASGFQQSGAMDRFAAEAANLLVDNSERDGVLEMTMLGVKVYFDEDNVIAITGAEFTPTVTDFETGEVTELTMNRAIRIKKGDVLDCGSAKSGLRGYLAVAGGFDIAPVMGSMSTNLKCKTGGFEGRKLRTGDVIPLRHPQGWLFSMVGRVYEPEKRADGTVTIHVIPGPQDDYFSDKGKNTFYSEVYSVTADSDRMGIKLDGAPVESIDGVDIISDGIVAGSVQIPSAGKPIIMMADRQTTGGYAKIATVITSDLPLLAQLRPGGTLRFKKVDLQYAVKRIKADKKALKKLQTNILRADTFTSDS